TQKFVRDFRAQEHIEPGRAPSVVDEPIAVALNRVLRELGAFDDQRQPRTWVVGGQVKQEDGLGWPDLRVCGAYETNPGRIRLGEDTTDARGCYTIRYERLPVVNGFDLRVSVTGDDGASLRLSLLIHGAKSVEIVDLTVPAAPKAARRRIEGQIFFKDGRAAEKLQLRLYRRG